MDTLKLRFLYKTVPGRAILKLLVNPLISKIGGWFLSTNISKYFIDYFIEKNNIDMNGILIPKKGFSSFNDFFKRTKLVKDIDVAEGNIISPCDGLLTILPISENTVFEIKNSQYAVKDLLQSEAEALRYQGGKAFIFRLTPAHYHRYSYCGSGRITELKKIQGVLHCVRPIALSEISVFVQNSREYQEVELANGKSYIQMEVGALMVGKISNHTDFRYNSKVKAGEEKGCFEFGGSTIICLFEKDAVAFEEGFVDLTEEEIPVCIGDIIGKIQ